MHGRALMPKNPVYLGTRDPNRRLRIGYVSPDFRYHAVSFFIEGIIAAHDPNEVEVTCYAEVASPDHVTDRFKRHAHRWRSTLGMTDEAVAEMIRKDEIDVLIDLAGHTGNNRLLTFARKPAPVQLGHMVGSGTTTGLAAIDAMLIDGRLLPKAMTAVSSSARCASRACRCSTRRHPACRKWGGCRHCATVTSRSAASPGPPASMTT